MHSAVNRFSNETLIPTAQVIGEHVFHTHSMVAYHVEWLGRQIHNFTHSILPLPIAVIAEAAIKSLPFTFIHRCCPLPVVGVTVVISLIYANLTTPQDSIFSSETHMNGLGFAALLYAGVEFIRGAVTGKGRYIKYGALYFIASAIAFVYAKLTRPPG